MAEAGENISNSQSKVGRGRLIFALIFLFVGFGSILYYLTPYLSSKVKSSNSTIQNPEPSSFCVDYTSGLANDYTKKLKRESNNLTSRLKYPIVGSNIRIEYIHNFNETNSKLHASYVKSAAEKSCAFPVKSPTPLPDTYPN